MKQAISIFSIVLLLVSCQQPEHGAPDHETLARKLFDTMRDNDFGKSQLLLPDKGTYRKIEEQNGHPVNDLTGDYEQFTDSAEMHFNTVREQLMASGTLKYIRSNIEMAPQSNLPAQTVVAKIESDKGPIKFSFTATKFNNRWYYGGDVHWVEKID